MTTYRQTHTIVDALLNHDGTVPTEVGVNVPDRGFVVGLGNEFGLQIDTAQSFGPVIHKAVTDWLRVAQTRTGFVGSWRLDRGTLYLDVVQIVPERADAEQKARDRGELAIYSLHNQEVIATS